MQMMFVEHEAIEVEIHDPPTEITGSDVYNNVHFDMLLQKSTFANLEFRCAIYFKLNNISLIIAG